MLQTLHVYIINLNLILLTDQFHIKDYINLLIVFKQINIYRGP